MKNDFTLHVFEQLLATLTETKKEILPFKEFISGSRQAIILRHDVDSRPDRSLDFARLQAKAKIRGTYYFRYVPGSFHVQIIEEIAALGHEIGYHYETMDSSNGDPDKAYDEFCTILEKFRKIVPVTTVCMHGSPLSKFDNRAIWDTYDYRKSGITGEPYYDLDFNKVFYITDTGRRWDGQKVSIRDKAKADRPVTNSDFINRKYATTFDIIEALNKGHFPDAAMMTFHPQRWTNHALGWTKELVFQRTKNIIKYFLVSRQG